MRFTFGRSVERHPIVFDEGTFDEGRTFSLFGFGSYSPREKQARDELDKAAYDKSLFTETFITQGAIKDRLWQERLARIKHLTGVELENPEQQGTRSMVLDMRALAGGEKGEHYFDKFKEQVAALATQYPEHADELLSFTSASGLEQVFSDEDIKGRAAQAVEAYKQAVATPYLSQWQKQKTEMGASITAFFSDPISTASMLIPYGGSIKGATLLGRIGRVMLAEAAINAGTESVLQATTYGWRRDVGLNVSVGESLTQIGLVGAIGGIVGGTLRGGGEGLAKLFGRSQTAQVTARDLEALAQELNMPVSDGERRLWQMAERQDQIGRAAFGEVLDGVVAEDGANLAERAVRSLYSETEDVLLVGADYAPRRAEDVARLLDEGFTPKIGETLEVGGRPVNYRQFDVDKIGVEAGSYQYKSGVDARGVTGRLAQVTQWKETGTGKVFVHQRKDGTSYIVDGHQRLEVGQRLSDEQEAVSGGSREQGMKESTAVSGGPPRTGNEKNDKVRLNGYLFDEADGWTVEDVRALAAQKNIGEGSGSVIDGARAIRQWPEIVDDGLAVSAEKIKAMTGLARLSDALWGEVEAGAVRPEYGAIVGRMVADEAEQGRVMADLMRAQPTSEREAARLVQESLAAGHGRVHGRGADGGDNLEILQPNQAIEPATKEAAAMAEHELVRQQGRLADKPEIATMWEHIASDSGFNEGFMAKQAEVMANTVRTCKL